MKILIIEDDKKIAQFLEKGLREEGYTTLWVSDGESGYQSAIHDQWDLIILDRMLPVMEGLTLCQKLRQQNIKTPVLILSAKGTIQNRVEGLDSGADDYLPKPFAFSELLARVRALTRRSSVGLASTLECGDLKLDLLTHQVTYGDRTLDLTSREFALLRFLMSRKGHVLSRTVIAESVWNYDFQSGTNIIDVYINYLRSKLKKVMGRDIIQTIRHRGYKLEDDVL